MTPEVINRICAEWAGIDTRYMDCAIDAVCPDDVDGTDVCPSDCPHYKPVYPDYFRSSAAMDLLGVLVERGYKPELSYHNLNWWCKFSLPGYKQPEYYAMKPTIPAAICHAIIQLIEREGR